MLVISLLIVGLLLCISYQDFSKRLIDWYFFPLAATLMFVQLSHYQMFISSLINFGLNIIIIIIMYTLSTMIISLRRMQAVNLLKELIGSADILSLLLLCIFFTPFYLVVFVLFSLSTGIMFQRIGKYFTKKAIYIPLAGIISFQLAIIIVLQDALQFINLNDDRLIMEYVSGFYIKLMI